MTSDDFEIRQERREEKLRKQRERMPQHGRALAKVYADAVRRRVRHLKKERP